MMRAIGMMSGTSMDGIDIALIETDGEANVTRAPRPAASTRRAAGGLAAAMVEASRMLDRNERPGSLGRIERQLTELHAQLVHDFLAENGVDAGSVDVIGFHGQTVLHRAEEKLTVQLGDGALLANLTRTAAKQMGRRAAENILRRVAGEPTLPFRYKDYGNLATIGRKAAIVDLAVPVFGALRFSGLPRGSSGSSPTSTS